MHEQILAGDPTAPKDGKFYYLLMIKNIANDAELSRIYRSKLLWS